MSSGDLNWDKEIAEIHQRRALAKGHGGQEAVAHHHAKGRMTLRERIDCLIDAGSFKESGMGAGGAVKDEHGNLTGFTPSNFILGFAQLDERPILIGGEDEGVDAVEIMGEQPRRNTRARADGADGRASDAFFGKAPRGRFDQRLSPHVRAFANEARARL